MPFDPALLEPQGATGFDPSLLEPDSTAGFDPSLLEPEGAPTTQPLTAAPASRQLTPGDFERMIANSKKEREFQAGAPQSRSDLNTAFGLGGVAIQAPPLPGQKWMGPLDFFSTMAAEGLRPLREQLSPENVRNAREYMGTVLANPEDPEALPLAEERLAGPNLPPEAIDKAISGLGQGGLNLAQTVMTPQGILMMGAGGIGGTAGKLVSAGFFADLIHSAPQVYQKLGAAFGSGDTAAITEALVDAVAHGIFTLGTAHGAIPDRFTIRKTVEQMTPDQLNTIESQVKPVPLTSEESLQYQREGAINASTDTSPAKIHDALRPQSEQGAQEVPAKEGGAGVLTSAQPTEAQAGTLSLRPAIRSGDTIVEGAFGKSHGDTITDATKSGDSAKIMAAMTGERGFVDQDGKWHTRKEAEALMKSQSGDFSMIKPDEGLHSEDLNAEGQPKSLKAQPEMVVSDPKASPEAQGGAAETILKQVQDMTPEQFSKLRTDYQTQSGGKGLTSLSYSIGDAIVKSGRFDLIDAFKEAYKKANTKLNEMVAGVTDKISKMPPGPEADAAMKPVMDGSSHPQFFNEVVQRAEWLKSGGQEHAGRFNGEALPEFVDKIEAAKTLPISEFKGEIPADHVPIKVQRPDGSTYEAFLAGAPGSTMAGTKIGKVKPGIEDRLSHGILGKGDKIIEGPKTAEEYAAAKSAPSMPPDVAPAYQRGNAVAANVPGLLMDPFGYQAAKIVGRAIKDIYDSPALKKARQDISDLWNAAALKSAPKLTRSGRALGEAGVRYASSFTVGRTKGQIFADKVLLNSGIDSVKFGTALAEDNLRSVRASHTDPAKVANVRTLVGDPTSPFKTEAEYQAFLNDPVTQAAIDRHKQLWEEQKDPLYRQANDLDPDLPLETRGAQTGARINLKALQPDEAGVAPIGQRAPGFRQLATLKRRDPFGQRAKGSGLAYEGHYHEIMANGFERELPVAAQHEFLKQLIDNGDAVVTDKMVEPDLELKGEGTSKGYLLTLKPYTGKFIHIRSELAGEFEAISGLDKPLKLPVLTAFNNFMTRQSVAGLAEGATHASNLLTQIFTMPGPTANPMINHLIKTYTGRMDLLYTIPKVIIKGFSNQRERMLELAEMGAAKEPYPGAIAKKILNPIDQGVRLVSDDVFKAFVGKGIVENTETNRREFINTVGQYNKRLQPLLTRKLRETGLQPFITAGQTFNAQGLRRLVMAPGVKATNNARALALKVDVASGWMGAIVAVTALNLLLSKKATGPTGTPLGSVGWVGDDQKVHTFNVFRLLGYERGMRITGIGPYIEAKRQGQSAGQALSSGAQSVASTGLGMVMGPGPRFATVAGTGQRPTQPWIKEAPRVPPTDSLNPLKSQIAKNIQTAIIEANPLLSSAAEVRKEMKQGKNFPTALAGGAQKQVTRYTPQTRGTEQKAQALPRIIDSAQLRDYVDDIAKEARTLPLREREHFIIQRFRDDELGRKYRDAAWQQVERKGVLKYK